MHMILTWLLITSQMTGRVEIGHASQVAPASRSAGSIAIGESRHVYGTVEGDAASIRRDVLHRSGLTTDKAVAAMATVSGGTIAGLLKQHSEARTSSRRTHISRYSPMRSLAMTISWLAVVLVVGFAVISVAGDKVDIVINTLRDGVGKSIWSGLLGWLAIIPGAVGVAVLLTVTIVGILLVPLGLAAYMIMVAGLTMFGFVAVLLLTGAAITGGKSRDETPRGAMLRAFMTGALAYLGLWVIAAALSWIPLVGALVRSLAAGASFVAVTAGLGAVLRSYWRGDFSKRAATG